ncbi:response regulator [Pseudomonas weihenstephanensis]|uniref:Histidine kinase n=1 Tax=Pseudomonas weihenstephanensis TaxID=1608994 RepID=A0A0J6IMG4_9PSED|nr:response regulator [Pseudomonas weihenstephanensis]KMN13438.1 histidine kinase [Pseudomonas weihenstephanensis]KMN18846.1 histidine kinase [Pseudomonas weihenstephanensis]MBM1191959.1 response regulator [Pseudomonas weihenstephanensis]
MTTSSSRQQLLLVDDEEDALLELAELLEGEGFCCFTAVSVKIALQQLTKHPDIALVITDLRMPEESGISLIKRLREHTARQHLPVIVMSGHADMDDVSDLLRLQVLDLFRKPIYHARLLDTLNNLFPLPTLSLAEH